MKDLNLLVLRCKDIEAAKTFYECFGVSFTKHRHGSGPEHYAAEDDRGVFELYPLAIGSSADGTGLGFWSEDLALVSSCLTKYGFSPGPSSEKPWGRTFVVRDPDGRRVEVRQKVRPAVPAV